MVFDQTDRFRAKLARGQICVGTVISFTDPTVTEVLCQVLDFVWIDMEHNALSLESVQGHIMATKGSETTPLVRVPWNDPVLIKPVLDIGAAGVIVPFVRTADEARRAVAACLYPPEGIRGFGPRRPSRYGQLGGPEFCRAANASVLPVVQIEHTDAVANIDEILAVPGLASIVFGPNDLAGSMGRMGQPRHPDVLAAIDSVIAKARRAAVPIGIGAGDDPDVLDDWVSRGVQWLAMGGDCSLLLRAATQVAASVLEHASHDREGA
jgi:2-dehydro-3-deoxyglucarate aldolase/4-hydroxy-2-oxoheptanedioate aldolase